MESEDPPTDLVSHKCAGFYKYLATFNGLALVSTTVDISMGKPFGFFSSSKTEGERTQDRKTLSAFASA